jgi:hypothetical protein
VSATRRAISSSTNLHDQEVIVERRQLAMRLDQVQLLAERGQAGRPFEVGLDLAAHLVGAVARDLVGAQAERQQRLRGVALIGRRRKRDDDMIDRLHECGHHTGFWRARLGSNQRPLASEANTLSTELRARGARF